METNGLDEKVVDYKKILQDKFPDMKPIKSPPSLGTLNSFGFSVFGKSNFDPETNTYTKYYAICALFLPILYLGAYRVADANEGGWYFLGKEKLNKFTKYWNYGMIFLILGGISLSFAYEYLTSPKYLTNLKMAQAEKIYQSGNIKESLKIYYSIVDSGTLYIPAGIGASEKIFDQDLGKLTKEEFSVIWSDAGDRVKRNRIFPSKNQFKIYGNKYFEFYKADDLKMADFIITKMNESIPEDKDLAIKFHNFKLLSFDLEPNYLPFVIAKAVDLESKNDFVKCEEILMPFKQELFDTEGAKILGNIIFDKGNYAVAYEILRPYFDSKIKSFHEAEKAYQRSYKAASEKAYKNLDSGLAGANWYEKYEKASKDNQDQMVQEYLNKEISKSTSLIQASKNLNLQSDVINIALQLGIALLNIASQSDEVEKINRLKEAETIFLSVQGSASDSDAYLLTYGEVLFWLRKQVEGEKLFASYLEKYNSDVKSLFNISYKFRSIGDFAKARELAEKAYDKSNIIEEKEKIASSLASMPIDTDYAIKWLERSNQNDIRTKAEILLSKGQKAVEKSDLKIAEEFYREAIKIYQKLPDNSSKLNNMSLVYAELYGITYKLEDLQSNVELLKKARDLMPKDTTILRNYTYAIFNLIFQEEMENKIDLKKIKGKVDSTLSYFNATNQEEKNIKILKLTENINFKSITPLFEQLVLLSPQSQSDKISLYNIYSLKKDIKSIDKIFHNIMTTNFNNTEYKKETLESYSNKNDEENLNKAIEYHKIFEGIEITNLNPENESDIILSSMVSQIKISRDIYGKEIVDFSPEILFFEKSYQNTPREFARKFLASFNLYQGLSELYQANDRYKKEVDKNRALKFSASYASFILYKNPELKAIFLNNKYFVKYLELTKTRIDLFPDSLNISGAICLDLLGFDKDDKIKNQFKGNLFLKPCIEINYKLYPLAIDAVLEKYFHLILFNEEKKAEEIIKLAIQEGVPL